MPQIFHRHSTILSPRLCNILPLHNTYLYYPFLSKPYYKSFQPVLENFFPLLQKVYTKAWYKYSTPWYKYFKPWYIRPKAWYIELLWGITTLTVGTTNFYSGSRYFYNRHTRKKPYHSHTKSIGQNEFITANLTQHTFA